MIKTLMKMMLLMTVLVGDKDVNEDDVINDSVGW